MYEINVLNMDHEMYNDGLYFFEQANQSQEVSEKWRNQRFAVISFASSFESFLNRMIIHVLKNDPKKVKNGKNIYDFLSEGRINEGFPKELKTIKEKLKLIEALYDLNSNAIIETSEFKVFEKLIYLRNDIVHYSHSKSLMVYGKELENHANQGAGLLTDLIFIICSLLNENIPSFYKENKYKPIRF